MKYYVAKTEVNDPAITSPEWERAAEGQINLNCWAGFEKSPTTVFKMLKTPVGLAVLLHTDERHLRAEVTVQNGEVCEDSCMEFFFKPDNHDVNYLNFEFNPLGVMHLGIGPGRHGRRHLEDDRAQFSIESVAKEGDWTLKFLIPEAFLLTYFKKISRVCRANLYKCGELTDHNHYAVWSQVETEQPDYHVPDFFGFLEL